MLLLHQPAPSQQQPAMFQPSAARPERTIKSTMAAGLRNGLLLFPGFHGPRSRARSPSPAPSDYSVGEPLSPKSCPDQSLDYISPLFPANDTRVMGNSCSNDASARDPRPGNDWTEQLLPARPANFSLSSPSTPLMQQAPPRLVIPTSADTSHPQHGYQSRPRPRSMPPQRVWLAQQQQQRRHLSQESDAEQYHGYTPGHNRSISSPTASTIPTITTTTSTIPVTRYYQLKFYCSACQDGPCKFADEFNANFPLVVTRQEHDPIPITSLPSPQSRPGSSGGGRTKKSRSPFRSSRWESPSSSDDAPIQPGTTPFSPGTLLIKIDFCGRPGSLNFLLGVGERVGEVLKRAHAVDRSGDVRGESKGLKKKEMLAVMMRGGNKEDEGEAYVAAEKVLAELSEVDVSGAMKAVFRKEDPYDCVWREDEN